MWIQASDVDKREVEALHLTVGRLPYQQHVADALLAYLHDQAIPHTPYVLCAMSHSGRFLLVRGRSRTT